MSLPVLDPAQYQKVSLERVDLHCDTFRITTREDFDELASSIRHDGLINAPTLIQKQPHAFAIVSGFRRIHACCKIGRDTINARILDSEASRLDCLRLAIAENAFQRQLNLIESSRAIHKLSAFFDSDYLTAEAAATLGLPVNPAILKKIRNLCLLPQQVQQSILDETISLSMAGELEKLDPESAVAFSRVFAQLKFSLNKQKEILTLVDEIARRENSFVGQVLADAGIKTILDNEDIDRNQKGSQLRAFLRRRRFPEISEAEKKYQGLYKQLKLGNDIKLTPPKDFEGVTFSLHLSFNNLAELLELTNKVDRLIEHPSLKKIVEG
jgi:ParB family chromosome partitioning protein